MALETPEVSQCHPDRASDWTLALGKREQTVRPCRQPPSHLRKALPSGRLVPRMDFKKGNLKDLGKLQILGKFCDSSLDMSMHPFKINEIHWPECDTLLSRVTALINLYTGVFPQNWCGVDSHHRKYWCSLSSPGPNMRTDSEPPRPQLNKPVRAVEWLPGMAGPCSAPSSSVKQNIPFQPVCSLLGRGEPC